MSTTQTMTEPASAVIRVSNDHLGIARLIDSPAGSVEAASKLLQKNHEKFHIYWRDVGGHNHMAHNVLTILALGGDADDLERAYNHGLGIQRPLPPLDHEIVQELYDPEKFRARIGSINDYTNFLIFFEQEIDKKGWREVCKEYCFARTSTTDAIFARLFEGAYHPLIHLGLGIEFEQPSIIAEALAQAATHDSAGIDGFFHESEKEAALADKPGKPLVQLFHDIRNDEEIRTASRMQDGPFRVRDGVIGRAGPKVASLASQFRVKPENLERAVAEMISCNAYISGAAQRPGKARKIDFFHMHNTTSSIFLTVLVQQPWIKLEDKIRLIEWKGRLDLVWYAASGAAELDINNVVDYKATHTAGLDWVSLYKVIHKTEDDGHVGKFVRAIKNGSNVAKPFESSDDADRFPIRGDLWFKVAQMAYDSTLDVIDEDKWTFGVGFEPMWAKVPNL